MQSSVRAMSRLGQCLRHRVGHVTGTAGVRATFLPRPIYTGSSVGVGEVRQQVKVTGGSGSIQQPPPAVTVLAAVSEPTMLQVRWGEGGTDVFPYVWLRDNCQCVNCFHPHVRSRQMLLSDLQLDVTPHSIKVSADGGQVEVQWSDGHLSPYPSSWLQDRAFNSAKQKIRRDAIRLEKKMWGRELQESLPRAVFQDLLEDDAALLRFLQELETVGVVVVSGVPCQEGQVHRFTHRVGYWKRTHYGETFTVQSKIDPFNLAYTTNLLHLHIDQPYFDHMSGIQLLHCIKQVPGEGGDSLLADALHVINKLKSLHPNKYEVLRDTLVDFWDVGQDGGQEFFIFNQKPMISLGRDGSLESLNYSQIVRDSYFGVPADQVAGWYDALLTFRDLLADPHNYIQYKMTDGDMIVFDNIRVLHGRMGYQATQGERHLEGCYWDWDMARSRRRVLQAKLSHS